MVRSAVSVPTATIGAVRLVAPIRATSTSAAALPAGAPITERAGTLFVALRINPELVDGLTPFKLIKTH